MIRVLLVDDELPVHEAFDIMLDWHEFGFEKPDSAYDASTALDMMRTLRCSYNGYFHAGNERHRVYEHAARN